MVSGYQRQTSRHAGNRYILNIGDDPDIFSDFHGVRRGRGVTIESDLSNAWLSRGVVVSIGEVHLLQRGVHCY